MARHHALKLPAIDPLRTRRQPLAILRPSGIPQKSAMPRRLTPRMHNPIEESGHHPSRRTIFRLRVLLNRRQIKDQICLN